MRKKIYEVIESGNNNLHNVYDGVMIVTIILSLIPLVVKGGMLLFRKLDIVCAIIFTIDYFLRLITADYKYGEKSVKSFIRYPFSFYAIADLLSILPTFIALNQGLKVLRILRMVKAMRMFRIIKAVRYSKNLKILTNVFKNSKESLLAVFVFAIGYILVSALIVFNDCSPYVPFVDCTANARNLLSLSSIKLKFSLAVFTISRPCSTLSSATIYALILVVRFVDIL